MRLDRADQSSEHQPTLGRSSDTNCGTITQLLTHARSAPHQQVKRIAHSLRRRHHVLVIVREPAVIFHDHRNTHRLHSAVDGNLNLLAH